MKAIWFWVAGWVGFAALSGFLALLLVVGGFNRYNEDVRNGFVIPRCQALFKLIPEFRPALQQNQVVNAAKAAKVAIDQGPGFLRIAGSPSGGGIVFTISGTDVVGIRDTF